MSNNRLFDVVCPACNDGKIIQKGGSVYHECIACSERLKCAICGSMKSLAITDFGTKNVFCGCCRQTWFWKEKMPISCASCGGDDADCRYCNKKLITDGKKIEALYRDLFKCPKCGSKAISPSSSIDELIRCLNCHNSWKITDFRSMEKIEICAACNKAHSVTKGEHCVHCGYSGPKIAEHKFIGPLDKKAAAQKKESNTNSDLPICKEAPYCPYCSQPAKKDVNGEKWMCLACSKTLANVHASIRLCASCQNGFISGTDRCHRCGHINCFCDMCGRPFADKTQKSGRCDICKSKSTEVKNGAAIKCPRCSHIESFISADLFCRCSNCEEQFASSIQNGTSIKFDSDLVSKFLRYEEKSEIIDGLLNDILDTVSQVRDTDSMQEDNNENFSELEKQVQELLEHNQYINSFKEDDEEEEDDEDEEPTDSRMEDSDRSWLTHAGHRRREFFNNTGPTYSNVKITDVTSEHLIEPEPEAKFVCDKCNPSASSKVGFCPKCKDDEETEPFSIDDESLTADETFIVGMLCKDFGNVENIKCKLTPRIQKAMARKNPHIIQELIEYLGSVDFEVQVEAVRTNGHVISRIDNPHLIIQKLALKQTNGWAIDQIKNPTDEIKQLAEKLKKQFYDEEDPKFYTKYYQNLTDTEKEVFLVVRDEPDLVSDKANIKVIERSENLQLCLVDYNPFFLQEIMDLAMHVPYSVQCLAVVGNGHTIEFINKPTEDIQLIAVGDRGSAIQFIKNPSEKVQLTAVRQDPGSIQHIKDPTSKVIKLVDKLNLQQINADVEHGN